MPEMTVQTEERRIIISAYEKPMLFPFALMAIIPQKPIKPPISLYGLNFSFFINKKDDVFELYNFIAFQIHCNPYSK